MRLVLISILAVAAAVGGFVAFTNFTRAQYALEVDATRDTTDISGTLYRIRVTNTGVDRLTGVTAELSATDVQRILSLEPGQNHYFYPEPDTPPATIRVTTNEGVEVVTGYRTPTKTLGLPGTGR